MLEKDKRLFMELPPRARRIQQGFHRFHPIGGTTSACAENTTAPWNAGITPWNYLRVRGEYEGLIKTHKNYRELPPRARRIRGPSDTDMQPPGTTSACAENTHAARKRVSYSRNYLRVRGEYTVGMVLLRPHQELPPRARRIPICGAGVAWHLGNYLRVRGEY